MPKPKTAPGSNANRVEDQVFQSLVRWGLLLKQNKAAPNVVSMVTGESVTGSWWAHRDAHRIFAILRHLAKHPDILIVKLLARKDTLVHRRLWPAVLGIGLARESWQLAGLSREARTLLDRISRSSTVRSSGPPARTLCERLLVHSSEVHSERGFHELVLQGWRHWALQNRPVSALSAPRARVALEGAVTALGAPLKWLPWYRAGGPR